MVKLSTLMDTETDSRVLCSDMVRFTTLSAQTKSAALWKKPSTEQGVLHRQRTRCGFTARHPVQCLSSRRSRCNSTNCIRMETSLICKDSLKASVRKNSGHIVMTVRVPEEFAEAC